MDSSEFMDANSAILMELGGMADLYKTVRPGSPEYQTIVKRRNELIARLVELDEMWKSGKIERDPPWSDKWNKGKTGGAST